MSLEVVTVFGGSGFVGRSIVRELAKTGARVRVAVRRPEQALSLKPMGDVGQITPISGNIRDDASVHAAVEGSDAVINLVGILYERGRQTFEEVHTEGAARIARAAAAAGARRFVQMSSIGANANADSDYARSKGAGEERVMAEFPGATVVRPSIVFGPDDDFFNRFAAMARCVPALPLIGGGHTRFQPVYVGDIADAVMAILNDDDTAGKTYELGGPNVYTFAELMEILLAEIRRQRLLLPLPFGLASLQALFLELMPIPPLTRDQVRQLRHDNVVREGALGFKDLGITPTALEVVLPTYLDRYRRGGARAA